MSTALTTRDFTNDQVALIRKTIAPTATEQEFGLFIYRCKHMDLDPLKPGQIFFIKYGNSPGTIVVGREGFRVRATRTGKHSGTKVGVVRDDSGKCIGAWCEIYRSDWQHPAREEVSLSEYNTHKSLWAKMPETMIKKVAEAAALRMAFPDELGGLYIREEMDQAEPREVAPIKPTPADHVEASNARVEQVLAREWIEPKTFYPSKFPEHLAKEENGRARFIEDFSTDELFLASEYLDKWKGKPTFTKSAEKALELVVHLLEKNGVTSDGADSDSSFESLFPERSGS